MNLELGTWNLELDMVLCYESSQDGSCVCFNYFVGGVWMRK